MTLNCSCSHAKCFPFNFTSSACDCRLTVYDHENYGGRSLLILQQNADFRNDWFNDRVESAVISGSCSWIFYGHKNFNEEWQTGISYFLRPGRYNSAISWGGPGNHITSARALPPDGTIAIVLFAHGDFDGRMTVLYGSSSHLPSLEFGDAVSSVIVIGGTWRVYERSYYQGTYTQLGTGHYRRMSSYSVGNDRISSVYLRP